MLSKICPCLSWLSSNRQPARRGYTYQEKHELQQQQFMHKLQSETKHSTYSNQLMNEQISIEDQLENQLNSGSAPSYDKNRQKPSNKKETDSRQQKQANESPKQTGNKKQQQELHHENQLKPSPEKELLNEQKPSSTEKVEAPPEKQYGFFNMGELPLNIPEYGENYLLLKEKTYNAADLLDISQINATQVSLNSGKTTQQSKLKINKSKLRVWRKTSQNCFVIQYELPCSYSFYNEVSNRKITPKQNDKLIRQYKLLETIQQNLTVRYLCLNKIGMMEPRQFTYLKYTNMSMNNPRGYWQLCISKNNETESNGTANLKNGKLYSVAYLIEEKDKDNNKCNLKIRTYLALDIGVTVDKVWEQILQETKNYIQEVWEDAANNYIDDELV